MKKIISISGMCLFLILALNSCTQEPVDVKTEIEAANALFMEAVNTGDAEALTNIYLPDATIYPPNTDLVTGADNIIPMMAGSSQAGVKMVFETVSAMAYGNTAIEEGKYKVLVQGETVVDHGKYIVIWVKEGNEWKVSKDIWNSSMPIPVPESSIEIDVVE